MSIRPRPRLHHAVDVMNAAHSFHSIDVTRPGAGQGCNECAHTEEDDMASNYIERLRRLSLNAPDLFEDNAGVVASSVNDKKSLALARLAALVAMGGAEPSFDEFVDAALSEGASADEIVNMLVVLAPVVGLPRVVEAAPKVSLALGHDIEADVN